MEKQKEILRVSEIFTSIQGEGTQCGRPMLFIRLSGCNLKCIYCDTQFAFKKGKEYSLKKLIKEVESEQLLPVYVTGGEPLIQPLTPALVDELINSAHEVFVDTNGTLNLGVLNPLVNKIIDIKTPGSQAGGEFIASNLEYIAPRDEVKFVVTSHDDFKWCLDKINTWGILDLTPNVIFQPAWSMVEPKNLSRWVISSGLPIRLGLQIHKYIWGPDATAV